MKKVSLLLTILLAYQYSSAQNYFQLTVDDTSLTDEIIYLEKIVPAPGGNFFIAGYIDWGLTAYNSGVVMMVDSSGNMLWHKVFSKDNDLEFTTVFPLTDGCYVGGGTSGGAAILVRLDLSGNVVESNSIQSNDSTPLHIGNMVAYNNDILVNCLGTNYWVGFSLFKITAAGNFVPVSRYLFSEGFSVCDVKVDGSNIYLVGWMWSGGSFSERKGIIARCNGEGNLLWAKKMKLNAFPYTSFRIGMINDDHTINSAYDARDFVWGYSGKVGLAQVDSDGNLLSHKEFTKSPFQRFTVTDMCKSFGNQISICGGVDTMVVFQCDENLNLNWSKYFDYSSPQYPLSMSQTEAGNLVLSGYNVNTGRGVIKKITSDGSGCNPQDYLLENYSKDLTIQDINSTSRSDSSFTISPVSLDISSPLISYTGCDFATSTGDEPVPLSTRLFPNPFNRTFTLATNIGASVNIYDLAGRLVDAYENISGEWSGGEQLLPGIYFIEIRNTSGTYEVLKAVKAEL